MEQDSFYLAMQYLEKALQLDRRNGVAYYNRGVVRNTIGKTDKEFMEADWDFERASLLGYQPPALWGTWGLALVNIGRYQEAVNRLSRAISLDPTSYAFFSRRGMAYLQLSREAKLNNGWTDFSAYLDLADKDFERAILLIKKAFSEKSFKKGEPDNDGFDKSQEFKKNSLLAMTYINHGSLKLFEKSYQETIKIYGKFFLDDSSDEDKEVTVKLRENDQMLKYIKPNEAATLFYNYGNAHFRLGEQKILEEGKEDFEMAAILFQKAINKNCDLIEAHYQLAIVCSRLNHLEIAKEQCNIGLSKLNESLQRDLSLENQDFGARDQIGVMTNRRRDLEGKLKTFKEKLDRVAGSNPEN